MVVTTVLHLASAPFQSLQFVLVSAPTHPVFVQTQRFLRQDFGFPTFFGFVLKDRLFHWISGPFLAGCCNAGRVLDVVWRGRTENVGFLVRTQGISLASA